MTGQWRAVVGYEGIYEVSDLGEVRSVSRTDARGHRRTGRLRVAYPSVSSGHLTVTLYKRGRRSTKFVHRLVIEAFTGPRPDGMEACHNNGVRTDNRASNLRWDTRSANQRDAVAHGTHAQAAKTKCPHGHDLRDPNLCNYGRRSGSRPCLACNKARRYIAHSRPHLDFQETSDRFYRRIMTGEFTQRSLECTS
ncbi:NUMOD4 motif-containing HNH endonuclease [Rhodococcus sp. BH5]|uniref:NUMOD4 motif-containing HNH endonuclease n=1 Tax=Rhodococcus sp. BH5 TaxID=2871702 RepID=UPI003FA6CBB2